MIPLKPVYMSEALRILKGAGNVAVDVPSQLAVLPRCCFDRFSGINPVDLGV